MPISWIALLITFDFPVSIVSQSSPADTSWDARRRTVIGSVHAARLEIIVDLLLERLEGQSIFALITMVSLLQRNEHLGDVELVLLLERVQEEMHGGG